MLYIIIIVFISYYHNLRFTAQADVKLLFGKEAGYSQ